jgi:hypothetical protein
MTRPGIVLYVEGIGYYASLAHFVTPCSFSVRRILPNGDKNVNFNLISRLTDAEIRQQNLDT